MANTIEKNEPQANEMHLHSLLTICIQLRQLLIGISQDNNAFHDWIPKSKVQEYLGYGDTQMAALISNGEVLISKVGRRIFINRQSLIQLLEKNIQN